MNGYLFYPLLAYLVGSINTSIILAHIFKLSDPRKSGSNNPGATNMMRTNSKVWGALALLGDAAKGVLAVTLIPPTADLIPCCLIAAFLGHLFPIYHRFQGGKGVATGLGIILGIQPVLALITLALWGLVLFISRWVSLASILSASVTAAWAFRWTDIPTAFALCLMAALLIIKHKSNILRILNGTEPKI